MTSFSISKYSFPNQSQKTKMIKLIKNKLTPLSETQKYPMGKNSFLDFKNLQKTPKLKKQHFNYKTRKSENQEAVMNDLMAKQLYKSDKKLTDELYKRPTTWLNLWKKTGDAFQNSYLTNRQNNYCNLFFPKQTRYTEQFQMTKRFRNSEHNNFSKSASIVLKKVQLYKQKKQEQIENKKKLKSKQNTSKSLTKTQKQPQPKANQDLQKHQNVLIDQDKQNQKHNKNDWAFYITKVILNQQINKIDQQKFYEQFVKRKDQNKLKQFIQEFQADKRTYRSCHVERTSYRTNIPEQLKVQKYAKRDISNQKTHRVSAFEQKRSQLLSFNNPTIRLKRLKSKCKSIQSQMGSNQQKQNISSYNCNKLRINSNHKKLIETMKVLAKA